MTINKKNKKSRGQLNPYYWSIRLFRERVLSIAQIPLCLQMTLRSTIVLLHVIGLGFPRANKRVDRFDRKIWIGKYRCRDYFWNSQARSMCASVGEKKTVSDQINIWPASCFHSRSFPSMGGIGSIWWEEMNKERWIGAEWKLVHQQYATSSPLPLPLNAVLCSPHTHSKLPHSVLFTHTHSKLCALHTLASDPLLPDT